MNFINGKKISLESAEKLRSNFSAINKKRKKGENKISLGVFVVGDDQIIASFVKIKKAFAEKIDVDFKVFHYDESILEEDFLKDFLQKQENVDAVIVQLPLPKSFDTKNILSKIDRKKDVDFLNPENILDNKKGKALDILSVGSAVMAPVSGAIFKIINSVYYDLYDKKIVIVGKGKLVGEPFSDDLKNMGLKENKDYFFIDQQTPSKIKKQLLRTADIIISGVGVPGLIKKEDIKKGVFLIDAGTSTTGKKLVGDISLDCLEKSKYFSKTPGGVGPLTVAVLYENLLKLVLNKK